MKSSDHTPPFRYKPELDGYDVYDTSTATKIGFVRKWEKRYNLRRVIITKGWQATTAKGKHLFQSGAATATTRDGAAQALLRAAHEHAQPSWENVPGGLKMKLHLPDPAKQRLLFIDFFPKEEGMVVRRSKPIASPVDEKDIKLVWTLWRETDPNMPPTLPFSPVHQRNAFLEDYMHDWNIDHKGMFRYASRLTDDPVWILLELK